MSDVIAAPAPRILFGFSHYPDVTDQGAVIGSLISRLRLAGLHIDSFCLTLDPPGPRLRWRDLDARWRRGDPVLMRLYERLALRLADYDVFVNGNGINLHPEMVAHLPTPCIYACFDDPETSHDISEPVAAAFDLSLVGNIAELDRYRSWGVRAVEHWPLGFRAHDADPSLTEQDILEGHREIAVSLLCERMSPWRKDRLDALTRAFPDGVFRGPGWPDGILPEKQRVALYRATRVGPNLHNSTGPVNSRTFVLPANGVLLVGDNREHLGKLFDLGREAVGFDTITECIDRCRYYLAHDRERREIAAAGWRRAWHDYNEIAVFRRLESHARRLLSPIARPAAAESASFVRGRRWRQPLRVAWHSTLAEARRRLRPIKHRLRRGRT